jgi:hypothetical protein
LAGFDRQDFGSPAEHLRRKISLTSNLARRFVIGGIGIIRISDRYLENKAPRRGTLFVSQPHA